MKFTRCLTGLFAVATLPLRLQAGDLEGVAAKIFKNIVPISQSEMLALVESQKMPTKNHPATTAVSLFKLGQKLKLIDKDEYESTEKYAKRSSQLIGTKQFMFINIIPPNNKNIELWDSYPDQTVKYDPDKEMIIIEIRDGSGIHDVISRIKSGTYIGSNSYGASAPVTQFITTRCQYFFRDPLPIDGECGYYGYKEWVLDSIDHPKHTSVEKPFDSIAHQFPLKILVPCLAQDAKKRINDFALILSGSLVDINFDKHRFGATLSDKIDNVWHTYSAYLNKNDAIISVYDKKTNQIIENFSFKKVQIIQRNK